MLTSCLRKVRTAFTIARECVNWPAIYLFKLGLNSRLQEVRVRRGPSILVDLLLRQEWSEVFEPAVADIYGIRNTQADLIIDIGANIGAFSCLAGWTHPSARIYAFEPNPAATKQAKINFRHNGLKNIQLIESVVTGDGREVILHLSENRGGVSIVMMGEGEKLSVPSVTLDCIPFAQARWVFFKLDCEGSEGEIIEWIIAHRHELPPRITIACEYHPWCPRPLSETLEALRRAGFQAESRCDFASVYLHASR